MARAPASLGIPNYSPVALLSSPLQIPPLLPLKLHFTGGGRGRCHWRREQRFQRQASEEVGSALSRSWWQFSFCSLLSQR